MNDARSGFCREIDAGFAVDHVRTIRERPDLHCRAKTSASCANIIMTNAVVGMPTDDLSHRRSHDPRPCPITRHLIRQRKGVATPYVEYDGFPTAVACCKFASVEQAKQAASAEQRDHGIDVPIVISATDMNRYKIF
jgi:hypothetical protein